MATYVLLRSGEHERVNERKVANNVMQGRRVCDGYLVCLDLCIDLPGNGARKELDVYYTTFFL